MLEDIVIDPAALVMAMPVPAVRFAATGLAKPDPINNCPFVNAGDSIIAFPEEIIIRLLFKAVEEFVPPLAIGNTPETCEANPTFPQDGAVDIPPEIKTLPIATPANLLKVNGVPAYKISPIV